MSDGEITAVQYGLGPIGQLIVETAAGDVAFVGAVDIDPEKVGRSLGDLVDVESPGTVESLQDVRVTDDADEALAADPDVVFHATASSLDAIEPQLEECIGSGADVISTSEALTYPWYHDPDTAEEIDELARANGSTCLGSGINPGFAMDAFPAVLTTPCRAVESVRVERVQDAAVRREPLQAKIGAGRSVEAFESEIATGAGHVGLPESVAMLGAALGWELDDVSETIEPAIADEHVESEYFSVEPGEVAGVKQVATGTVDGEERIELDLQMYLGAADPRDRVSIRGTPDVVCTVEGGFHGDVTTPAIVTNNVPRVRASDPGLKTMLDLSLPHG